MAARRPGFTLIELIVVISVVLILVAALLPALGMLRRNQKITASRQLLGNCVIAVSQYLGDYAILGDLKDATASDFAAAPMRFLIARPQRARGEPYLQPKPTQVAAADGSITSLDRAELLLDPFAQPLRFTATNARARGRTAGAYDFTSTVRIVATAGTMDDPADDLEQRWSQSTGEWSAK